MRGKSIVTIGFLSIVAVTGVVNASSSFASDASRVNVAERIGHGGSIYQSEPDRAGVCQVRVDMVERIGAGGSIYSSSRSRSTQAGGCQVAEEEQKRVDIIERIGAGGSTYSFSSGRPMS
ncbi:MAG: hypothetical protein KF693_16815 [Nitrospira sp.]|nr:hypothetical protein [Nitrospira sp.]